MQKKLRMIPLMALAMAFALALSACGQPSAESQIRDDLKNQLSTIDASNEEFIKSMKESAGSSFDQVGVDVQEFAKAYLDGYGYEIGDVTVNEQDGTATAKATLHVKSLSSILSNFQTRYIEWAGSLDPAKLGDSEQIMAEAGKIIMEATKDTETKDTEVTLSYERSESGTWTLAKDSESVLIGALG